MRRSSARGRLVRRSAALAGMMALGAVATAHADISGTVRTPAGAGVPGVTVTLREPDNDFAASDTTDGAGRYAIPTGDLSGNTAPFTASTSTTTCRSFAEGEATAAGGPVNDGAVLDLVLDARLFCGSTSSSTTPPTGHPWPERGQLLAAPGGTFNIEVLAPFTSSGYTIQLPDGTVLGTSTSRFAVPFTAPATPYNGPVNLAYTEDGVPQLVTIGTLITGAVVNPNPPSGVSDLVAIVDVSGSMSGTDPTFRRKDAGQLLVDLAGQGDRIAGVGFDDEFHPIFPRTTVSGQASKNALKRQARRNIVNSGGTDYNDGISQGFDALAADPLNPQVPKAAIFLTDGAHNSGDYQNAHLRFAFNGTGRSWPICVIQLGPSTSFNAADTARLRRIARETGGVFSRTPTNTELENIYFQCRGRTSGSTTLLKRTNTFRVGQARTYTRRVKARQRKATFFVSFGVGKYRLRLTQPGGKVFNRTRGKVRLVRGNTFAFFEVRTPKAGNWRLRVLRLPTGGVTDKATTTITVQRRS
jgi:hypothetical protein